MVFFVGFLDEFFEVLILEGGYCYVYVVLC